MFLLINDTYKFIILTFPKSGCSTIRYIYQKVHSCEFPQCERDAVTETSFHAWTGLSYMSRNIETLRNPKYKEYYKVGVIRNTYERVCSMYFNRHLDIRYELKFKGIASHDTFIDFLNRLKNLENQHFQPQIGHPCIDEYIFLDNIYEGLFALYNRVNLNPEQIAVFVDLKNSGIAKEQAKNKIDFKKDLSSYDFKKDVGQLGVCPMVIPSYENMLNEETTSLIYARYKDEIDTFSFKVPNAR